jgi:hypothetical protein
LLKKVTSTAAKKHVKTVARITMKKRISTGVAESMSRSMEVRCGGAAVKEVRTNLAVNSQSTSPRRTRRRNLTT